MQDLASSFSSVESMLRWQIELARKRAHELQASLKKCGELYPLPKSTDGLPESWAFGKLTHNEVALAHALGGIQQVFGQIDKAESALSDGDSPTAIYWIISAQQSIWSTTAAWQSSGATRMYRYIGKIRQAKSINARNDRKKKPSKDELLTDRNNYYATKGHYQGWQKQARGKYKISDKTINAIIGELEK